MARAAGSWRVEGADLVLIQFWADPNLDAQVAVEFCSATVRVAIDRADFGIVGAAIDARPKVSLASDLLPSGGSGMWLRRFGADRSIAVPRVVDGRVVAVASVALTTPGDDEAIRVLGDLLETGEHHDSTLDGLTSPVKNGVGERTT